ncbi:MAG: hypothetical protein ACXWWC_11320 [Chitinophagaceae bacterium]
MKNTLLTLFSLGLALVTLCQSYNINWGDEIKLKKGTTDLDIISADNTGLYFTESRLKMKSYFVIGATYGTAQKLIKFDKNYSEVFDKEYKKELKGLDYHSFQPLENDIYLFSTDYVKKEKLFKAYGAKIDKNSGDLQGDFAELGSFALESKRDDYEMKMKPIRNGKNFLMVANISGKDRVSLGISLLDRMLKIKENTVINLTFNHKEFSLQDVQYTINNKIILLGKQFEETQVGKKKKKRFVFKQYVMMIYNNKGQKEKDIALNSGDKFIISGQLIEQADGGMLLAGFYSNTSKKEDLNGFFINKVDPQNGDISLSSFKEINAGMLGNSFEDVSDEDDDTKENRKRPAKANDDDDEEEFPNNFIIKSVDINPSDNSIIITSEVSKYSYYSYTTSSYNSTTRTWNYTTNFIHKFTNQDILVINSDKDGNIKWVNALPKFQLEEIRTSSNSRGGVSFYNDYSNFFAKGGGMPYYSSYASFINKNNLVIILNDHTSNNVNAQYGDKVKRVFNFKKRSNVYGISMDLVTGTMTKKFIAANNGETILMPRHGYVVKNELIVPSWRMHALAKTELKFAKITVK